MFDEYGNYYGDYDMENSWQWSEGYEYPMDEKSEEAHSSRPEPAEEQPPADPTVEEYYKGGKGRGKGKGVDDSCFICGSKWHQSMDCRRSFIAFCVRGDAGSPFMTTLS